MKKYPQLGLIVLLSACTLLGPVSITMYTPSMPAIAAGLGATLPSVQNTLAIFLLGFGIAHFLWGPLSDRFGRRPVILVGLALYTLSALACAHSTTIGELQLARFFQGAMACSGPLIARAIVRDRFEGAEALQVFSFIGIILILAPVLGPLVGGELQVWFDWQAGFYVLVGWGALMLALCGIFLRESNANPIDTLSFRSLIKIYGELLRNKSYAGAVLVVGFIFSGFLSFQGFTPFLLVDELSMRPNHFGLLKKICG
uniref:Bcr/CflA family efflux transporter n=1 Tax=Candidatus Kentrum sp. FW TaxID=2126338 RepID=A0A450TDK3_9GAMM|nr:MAG: MFS transporter, DHA1 family, bicyclomycin/chloramphenicol resistance protein [Candidatus Kentron sp. FW]